MIRVTDLNDIRYIPCLLDYISSDSTEPIYLSAKGRGFDHPDGIALLQVIFLDQVFILDPVKHGHRLFDVQSETEPLHTLRSIIQDPGRLKVTFDIRSLSNYLLREFNIVIDGALDLQILDAQRFVNDDSPYLASLSTAVLRSHGRKAPKWIQRKVTERIYKARSFVDEKGGNSAPLYDRPLSRKVIFYCSLDAILLPYMMAAFVAAPERSRSDALRASRLRVLNAISEGFILNGPERKLKEAEQYLSA
ncbi:hypothetical protein IE53DRAFT_212098 [Violaceomyces palustris]|uniref:Uncharacterized protein n=1 Tax=Violaceomyces palustris TaxID=1673888 RepID=A0ACD0NQK4_9BASI|nr:hypothetical protein IE53DRAFT_212098 [Violaceomyces palustris]